MFLDAKQVIQDISVLAGEISLKGTLSINIMHIRSEAKAM